MVDDMQKTILKDTLVEEKPHARSRAASKNRNSPMILCRQTTRSNGATTKCKFMSSNFVSVCTRYAMLCNCYAMIFKKIPYSQT